MNTENRLIVISHRLPINVESTASGYEVHTSSGGLVTALDSVLRKYSGVWIGHVGQQATDEVARLIELASLNQSYQLHTVLLSPEEVSNFYHGFSNEIIWPLFHDLQSRCNFSPEYWSAYCTVNERFAETAVRFATHDSFVWVHDYHFTLLAQYLRRRNDSCGIGLFQHIPFPPPDIFEKLPWRRDILRGMLMYDVVGFQTQRDQNNFGNCLQALLPECTFTVSDDSLHVRFEDRSVRVKSFPISIDFHAFADVAAEPAVRARARQLRQEQQGRKIILGVDRLDYTKGIIERLRAYSYMLRTWPQMRRGVTMVQVVVPSRVDIPKYLELKEEVERLVGEINGEFSDVGWVPVHYLYRTMPREELIAHYVAADIALITPLKDGMNLVAKEYCASQVGNTGVLILSEFAGAAKELLDGALLVNPNDQQAVAHAIMRAAQMPVSECVARMQRLRRQLREHDVYDWAESFLEAGANPAQRRTCLMSARTSEGETRVAGCGNN